MRTCCSPVSDTSRSLCLCLSRSHYLSLHSTRLLTYTRWAGNLSVATGICLTCFPTPVPQVLAIHFSSFPTSSISHVSHFLFPCCTRSYHYLLTPACSLPVYLRQHLLRYHVHLFLQQTSTETSTLPSLISFCFTYFHPGLCHSPGLPILSPKGTPTSGHTPAPDTCT